MTPDPSLERISLFTPLLSRERRCDGICEATCSPVPLWVLQRLRFSAAMRLPALST